MQSLRKDTSVVRDAIDLLFMSLCGNRIRDRHAYANILLPIHFL